MLTRVPADRRCAQYLIRAAAFVFSVAVLLGGARTARADSFQLTYSGSGVSGVLDLTATSEGSGEFLVTAMTGTYNGVAVTFLAPTAPLGTESLFYTSDGASGIEYDDLLFPTSDTVLDSAGLAFDVAGVGNGAPVNLYSSGTATYLNSVYTNSGSYSTDFINTPITISLVQTPEPASAALLLMGLSGVFFAGLLQVRRRLEVCAC